MSQKKLQCRCGVQTSAKSAGWGGDRNDLEEEDGGGEG